MADFKVRQPLIIVSAARFIGAAEGPAFEPTAPFVAEGLAKPFGRGSIRQLDGHWVVGVQDGPATLNEGDWIVKSPEGEFSVISDANFNAHYEAV